MGKRKGKMWNRKRKAENQAEKATKEWKPYGKTISSNPKLESYYAVQGLHSHRREGDVFVPCSTDEEKEVERLRFMAAMTTTLPASFRIGQNIEPEFREKIVKDVEKFVGTEIEIEIDEDGNAVSKPKVKKDSNGEAVAEDITSAEKKEDVASDSPSDAPKSEVKTTTKKLAPAKSIPFIPSAYQLSVDRRTIRRNPALQEFHNWLKVQTDSGFITRQETVSMIPPIVLSPEPHHAILDMCAGKFLLPPVFLLCCGYNLR